MNFFLRANRITKNISPSLIHTHKKRGTLLRRRLRERREEGVSLLLRESSFFSLSLSSVVVVVRIARANTNTNLKKRKEWADL